MLTKFIKFMPDFSVRFIHAWVCAVLVFATTSPSSLFAQTPRPVVAIGSNSGGGSTSISSVSWLGVGGLDLTLSSTTAFSVATGSFTIENTTYIIPAFTGQRETRNVTGVSGSGTVTITLNSAANTVWHNGDTVWISGVSGCPELNAAHTITIATATTVTVPLTCSTAYVSGGVFGAPPNGSGGGYIYVSAEKNGTVRFSVDSASGIMISATGVYNSIVQQAVAAVDLIPLFRVTLANGVWTAGSCTAAGPTCIDLRSALKSGNVEQGDGITVTRFPTATQVTADATLARRSSNSGANAFVGTQDLTGATTLLRSMTVDAIAAPSTPASGKGALYVDSTSKNIAVKDDAGVVKHGVQDISCGGGQFVSAVSAAGAGTCGTPAGGGWDPLSSSVRYEWDDFIHFSGNKFGYGTQNTGCTQTTQPESGHIGVWKLAVSGTTNNSCVYGLATGASSNIINAVSSLSGNTNFQLSCWIKTDDTTIANLYTGCGIGNTGLLGAAGFGIKYDTGASDVNWMCFNENSGLTVTSTGLAVATNTWYLLKVAVTGANQITCTVNGANSAVVNATFSASGAAPAWRLVTWAATAHNMLIDFWAMKW